VNKTITITEILRTGKATVKEKMLFSRLMAGARAVLTSAPMTMIINAEGKKKLQKTY